MIVHDHLLRDALAVIGYAGIVTDDDLDLLAGNSVTVLRYVEFGAAAASWPAGPKTPVIGTGRFSPYPGPAARPAQAPGRDGEPTRNKAMLNHGVPPNYCRH